MNIEREVFEKLFDTLLSMPKEERIVYLQSFGFQVKENNTDYDGKSIEELYKLKEMLANRIDNEDPIKEVILILPQARKNIINSANLSQAQYKRKTMLVPSKSMRLSCRTKRGKTVVKPN